MVDHGKDHDAWTDNIRRQLETSARDLDGASLSRLNQARQAALQLAKQPKPARWLWPTLAASAFSLALAVALWPRLQLQTETAPVTSNAQDFPMLAGEDDLDFYQDLDFYAWLDAQPASG